LDNIEKIGYAGSNSPHKAKKKFTAACNLWRRKIKHKKHEGPADFLVIWYEQEEPFNGLICFSHAFDAGRYS